MKCYKVDLTAWNHWFHAMDGHVTDPLWLCPLCPTGGFPAQVLICDLSTRGRQRASCWVRDVTCGTELHAVWPRSGHSSRCGETQHDRNPTTQICQRWRDSAGQLCSLVSHVSGVRDWIVVFHSSLASLIVWCIAWFQASGRDCGTFLLAEEKCQSPSSSEPITTHFYHKTF